MKRLILVYITISLLGSFCCSSSWGALKQFIPKYVDYSGKIGISGLYEEHKVTSSRDSRKTTDLTLNEGINLTGLGYIYSPLFVSMSTSVTFAFEQTRIADKDDADTSNGDANQFKQIFKFLPAHPYNFEIYGQRRIPMRAGSRGSTVIYSYGGKAVYQRRPWDLSLTYRDQETKSDTPSNNDSLSFHSNFFNDLHGIQATGIYDHSNFDLNESEGERDIYGVSFKKQFESFRFRTRWSQDKQKQQNSPLSTFSYTLYEQQDWHNELHATLPNNFSTRLAYNTTENDSHQENKDETRKHYNDSERYSFHLGHRLYRSLNSAFRYGHTYSQSNGGKSTQKSYQLNEDYSKKMRWGGILNSWWGNMVYLDSKGTSQILFENHSISSTISPPNSFTLNYKLIESNSIKIYIIDHNSPSKQLILLNENQHYWIDKLADGTYQVEIWATALDVSGLTLSSDDLDQYSFQADYAISPADYLIRTTNWGGSLQLSVLNNLLTPRYSYSESKQELLDGFYPGEETYSTTHSVGIGLQYSPYQAALSQSWQRSNSGSTDTFTASTNYKKELTDYTSGNISLTYENSSIDNRYSSGAENSLNETFYSVQGQLHTFVPQHQLSGSLSGNYTLFKGNGETTSYSLLSVLNWRVGQLDLNLSGSYINAESSHTNKTTTQENTLIKFIVKRELF